MRACKQRDEVCLFWSRGGLRGGGWREKGVGVGVTHTWSWMNAT
jgi:hypothetical protein